MINGIRLHAKKASKDCAKTMQFILTSKIAVHNSLDLSPNILLSEFFSNHHRPFLMLLLHLCSLVLTAAILPAQSLVHQASLDEIPQVYLPPKH